MMRVEYCEIETLPNSPDVYVIAALLDGATLITSEARTLADAVTFAHAHPFGAECKRDDWRNHSKEIQK